MKVSVASIIDLAALFAREFVASVQHCTSYCRPFGIEAIESDPMYFQGVSANVLPSLVYDHEAALARLESLFLRPKGLEM